MLTERGQRQELLCLCSGEQEDTREHQKEEDNKVRRNSTKNAAQYSWFAAVDRGTEEICEEKNRRAEEEGRASLHCCYVKPCFSSLYLNLWRKLLQHPHRYYTGKNWYHASIVCCLSSLISLAAGESWWSTHPSSQQCFLAAPRESQASWDISCSGSTPGCLTSCTCP